MKPESAGGATYVFVMRGELDARYGELFEGMEMTRTAGTTVVVGSLRDQAQFYGLVDRIEELGLELISAQKTATSPAGSGQERNET
jgi:hypothetical protein